jgi:hypothetical protein
VWFYLMHNTRSDLKLCTRSRFLVWVINVNDITVIRHSR